MCKGYLLPLALLLLLSAAAITGCKKKGLDKTTVTIVNRLDKTVTLDLYASEADYAANTNLMDQVIIKPNENLSIPGSTFENGKTYYMDWYTDDYYYNNWYNDNYPIFGNRVKFSPRVANNTYYLEPALKGQGRSAFLKGAGTQTSWIAVGAYLYSSSIGYSNRWDIMDINERYRRVTIKKDFTAEYMRKNTSGSIVTENFEFMVQQTEVPYIEFKTGDGQVAGNMTGGKLPVAAPPDYKSNSIDTIMALFPDNELIFMMVRQ